jgi:EmrB/QacA subfamily drug resistance transporter
MVLSAGVFLGAIDAHLVNVAFPDMLGSFPSSDLAELSWVFNGYTITFTAALLPAGGLADRFGTRRLYLIGLTVFTASAAVCAVAPSAWVLITARLVQGAGGGILTPLALALFLPHQPPERRGMAIGLWSATQSIAIASGPSLGGFLVRVWDWRTIFLLHLPLGAVALAGARWALPPDPPRTDAARLPDMLGIGIFGAAIGLPALAIVQSHEWGIADGRTAITLVTGLALGAVFVRRTLRHPNPIVDLGVLRLRGTRTANLAMFLLGLIMFTWTLTAVLFLTGVWGYDEARAGLAVAPGPFAQAVAAPVAGRLVARTSHRAVALTGVMLLGAGAAWLTLSAAHDATTYAGMLLPALLSAGAGVGALITSLSAAAVAEVPRERLATGAALSVTSRACAAVIGLSTLALVLAGQPRDSIGAYRWIWATMTLLCLLLALTAARLRAPKASGHGRRPLREPDGRNAGS